MTDQLVPVSDLSVSAPGSERRASAGDVIYPPRGSYGPRRHLDYQLVLVHSGSARMPLDRQGREIKAGQVGLLRPGTTEFFTYADNTATHHSWIAVPPHYLNADERTALNRVADCLSLSHTMRTLVDAACNVAAVDPPHRPVLTAMARAATALYVAEAQHCALVQTSAHPVVTRAQVIAQQHACDGMEVGDLAREVGVSPEHLARLFRRDVGVSPGAYLRAERLSRAMYLLEHTGLSVADIAHHCGFASPQHFARRVHDGIGIAPTQLRARWWTAPDTTE